MTDRNGMEQTWTAEPQRTQLPIVDGRLRDFADDPITCMRRLQETGGNLVALQECDQQIVFAFGADLNRQILSRGDRFHSQFFAIRGPKNSSQRRLTSGLLSMNGKEHADQRRVVRSVFEKRAIPGYTRMVEQHARQMLADWRPGQTRDLSREMTDLMLRITSSMLFGMDDDDLAFEIGHMMDQWVQLNHELGMAALISNDGFFPGYQNLLSFAEVLEDRVREMINRRASQPEASTIPGNDVISLLLQARNAGHEITESQLVGQVALLFAAAHMTTAHTLAWTLFLLTLHPEESQILCEHIGQADTNRLMADHQQASIRMAVESSMDPLQRVIRESMRVLPASAYSQRVTNGPVELNGIRLKPGTLVVFSQFMTHRNEDLFPQPGRFRPDRWETVRPSAYEYLPFGGGARLCLGAPLALSILQTVVPMVLRHCGLQLISGAEINTRVVSTMLSPTTSIPVRLLTQGTVGDTVAITGNVGELVDMPATQADKAAA